MHHTADCELRGSSWGTMVFVNCLICFWLPGGRFRWRPYNSACAEVEVPGSTAGSTAALGQVEEGGGVS